MATNYQQQASEQLQSEYNQKKTALKNQLAGNLQSLETQKTGINNAYDKQVANQQLQNKLNKNSVSNAMLGRGLGNSSIAVSGLAEQDAKNTRLIGDINSNRTSALSDIEAQKALMNQNYNNEIAQMEADRLSAVRTLAYQLEDRQFEKDYKNQQLDLQRQAQKATEAYQNAYLALQRENAQQEYAYKNASLAQQSAYQNASLAWQKEQFAQQMAYKQSQRNASNRAGANQAFSSFLSSYGDIMADTSLSGKEKKQYLNALAEQAQLYEDYTGYDLSSIINKANGYSYAPQANSTASVLGNSWGGASSLRSGKGRSF